MPTACPTISYRFIRNYSICLLGIVFLMACGLDVRCTERFQRRFDRSSGLPLSEMFSIQQDREGFFWIGTSGGLYRFDGSNALPWAPSILTKYVRCMGPDVSGRMLVLHSADQTLYRVVGDAVMPVSGPEGSAFSDIVDAVLTGKRLWVARRETLFYSDDDLNWNALQTAFAGEQIRRLSAGLNGDLYISTRGGLWQIGADSQAVKLVTSRYVNGAVAHPEGFLYYVEKLPAGGRIMQIHEGRSVEVVYLTANFNSFILRGRTVWAAFDRRVIALKPNEPPLVLGPNEGFEGGGVFVDNEGSLWHQSRDSLRQFPEPETVLWNEKDGLPMSSTLFLLKTTEGLWVSTWGGLGRLTPSKGGAWQGVDEHLQHNAQLCVDGKAKLWAQADWHYFFHRENGRFIKHEQPDSGALSGCATSSDGAVWLVTSRGLFRAASGTDPPRAIDGPFGAGVALDQVIEGGDELWVTSNNQICHASAALVASGQKASWFCAAIDGVSGIGNLIELPDGALWAVAPNGVWRYLTGEWRKIAASSRPEFSELSRLELSPSGGVWVMGRGLPFRVIDRPDLPEGWQVVERLSVWQGLPATASIDILEEPDRGLWITTPMGVAHLSAEARETQPQSPPIKPVSVVLNGRSVGLQMPLQLPYGANQIELQFVALSFRDPALLRYQYRLRQTDSWTDSGNKVPIFRFFDLRPGNYAAQVRASLDGQNWSSQPAEIDFEVLGPWYLRWWALALFGLSILAVAVAAYRARVGVLVGLERQRMRIARDLHDEIGSGLGSIGILSSVAHTTELDDTKRQELAKQIADTANELGASLSDIVWSLRADSGTLEDLAYYLRQRANRLFPNGTQTLITDFPDVWPRVNLSLAVRRNLLLIAIEALHNSARHSGGREVVLGIAPAGNSWRMWIADDGSGFTKPADDQTSRGLGQQNMQLRAKEIRAEISLSSTGGGTVVTVVFSPQAK